MAMRLTDLYESAYSYQTTYWFNPRTNEVISADNHGTVVMTDPQNFGIDSAIVDQMWDCFDQDDGSSNDDAKLPSELVVGWPPYGRWNEDDAWEQLAMNRGWVRVGEGGSSYASYFSASTCDAIWTAVRYVTNNGNPGIGVEIEISRSSGAMYGKLSLDSLDKFIKGGARRAEEFLRRNLSN